MTLVYKAGRRVWRVRGLLWLSLVVAVWFVIWGFDLYRTYGLRPADGGVLAPEGVRRAWAFGMGGLGVAFAVGMWVYARAYVAALWIDDAGDRVAIQTVGGWWGTRIVVARRQVRAAVYHDGRFYAGRQSVRAPWYTMRVDGHARRFVVDAQGTTVDQARFQQVLSGGRR